jgi:excisionase family DNA binding protein
MENDMLTLREAADRCGLKADTLRSLIRYGRLAAVKRGRDYFVTIEAIREYLKGREHRGRYRGDIRIDDPVAE